ncbi:MAG TPA: sialate O-acetylesterase [Humisphaera sp.]
MLRKLPMLVAALGSMLALSSVSRAADAPAKPVKVFVLAGQSNMEGKAKVALLDYQVRQPATRDRFKHWQTAEGKWAERDDVFVKFLDRKGKLTVGFGSKDCVGPELEFGRVVGDAYAEPVLLIKTAWGGRSLYRDFRPPSAGMPPAAVLEKALAKAREKKPATTLDDVKAPYGASYRAMLDEVRTTLADLKAYVPGYAGQGYELAGFVWFQGWNDMIDDAATAEYATNLGHLIRDVRKDLGVPKLPVVVGQMGVDGANANAKVKAFKDAQAAGVAVPEFAGNVALVKTDVFWDIEAEAVYKKGWREHKAEWDTVGSDYPFHYLGSGKTMFAIGQALGEAALGLAAKK